MPARIKKTKEKITLTTESKLLRAAERQAAREKLTRVAWINETIAHRLRELGKW